MSEFSYVEQPILRWLCGEREPPQYGAGGLLPEGLAILGLAGRLGRLGRRADQPLTDP